jgi:hypothetical protein
MARQAVKSLWCTLFALGIGAVPAAAAQDRAGAAAALRAHQERIRALEDQVRVQNERIRVLEYEAADERRRADAILAHANRRVTEATAEAERKARLTGAELAQLRLTYQTETAALQSIVETATARASAAEQERWVWGALALLVGLPVGAFAFRTRRPAPRLQPEAAMAVVATAAADPPVLHDQADLFPATERRQFGTSPAH